MLDASAAIAWFFEDERDDESIAMAKTVSENGAIVPALFRWEVQNALLMAVRRKRLAFDQAADHLRAIDELGLVVDSLVLTSPLTAGLGLAQRFELTAYDAAYLELAVRRSAPIMTRDDKLMSAAANLDVLWKA